MTVESHSLFEIDQELDDLLEQNEEQIEAEGEPSEELLSRFREFCAAHGEKVDRIGRFVKTMEAREQFCRAEAARLGERARATANKVDRTKSMVLFYLMSRELRKIEGREFTLRIQKNSQDSVRILDEVALPPAYRTVPCRADGRGCHCACSHRQPYRYRSDGSRSRREPDSGRRASDGRGHRLRPSGQFARFRK